MGERAQEKKLLKELGEERHAQLTLMHLRDMWAVDGLYFLGIEDKFGTEAATRIDADVWKVMGKIEGKRLKEFLSLDEDLPSMIKGLKYSGWAMDLEDKAWEYNDDGSVLLKTLECRIQNTRVDKGLEVFPCKRVRWGFLKAFARIFNENIDVICNQCPPDDLEPGRWCEWIFRMKEE